MVDEPRRLPATVDDALARQDRDEFQYTDTGNARVYVNMMRELVRYVVDTGQWLVWNGTCWEPDIRRKTYALTQNVVEARRREATEIEDEQARQRTLNIVTSFEGVKKRQAMLDIAATDGRLQLESEDLDRDPHQLVCPNGVVDLDTGRLRSGQPKDLNSRQTGVPYDPEVATSELLDEYLKTFLPAREDQRFVFAVLGNALHGGNARRTLPIFWGDTTSGKSQLFTALHKILGSYICTIGSSVFRGNLDDKPRPDLVMAMFTRIAWASEAARGWKLHADQVKRLTGGEPLPYRDLFSRVVNKIPRFTPMIVTNEIPEVSGVDTATQRRVLVVHFDKTLSTEQEDPRKKDAFLRDPRTLQAVLTRLVRGARDPIIDEPPARFLLATMDARSNMDHTDEFLAWATENAYLVEQGDPVTESASSFIKADQVHALYVYWIKKHGDAVDRQSALNIKALSAALRTKGWASKPSAGTRWLGWKLGAAAPIEARFTP